MTARDLTPPGALRKRTGGTCKAQGWRTSVMIKYKGKPADLDKRFIGLETRDV